MKKNGIYSIQEAADELQRIGQAYLAKGDDGGYLIPEKDRNPVCLIGPPGVGKTDTAREAAGKLGIGFAEYSLAHHTRASLLGLPAICEDAKGVKHTEYTMSEIISTVWREVDKGYPEGILFLDEFPCMSESIAPVILAFLQYKKIGMHSLPDGWFLVLAGNPEEYNRSVRRFDAVTIDRMRVMNVDYDVSAWLDYANKRGVHPDVIEYVGTHQKSLYIVDLENEEQVVTPRSWTNLSSNMLVNDRLGIPANYRMIRQFIKSDRIAGEFFDFLEKKELYLKHEDMEDLLKNGEGSKKFKSYVSQVARIGDANSRHRMITTLCRYTVSRVSEMLEGDGASDDEPAGCIGNTYRFLEAVSEKEAAGTECGASARILTDLINENTLLLKYAGTHTIPAYNEVVMATYHVGSEKSEGHK